jgi:hypothetical protein
MDIDMAAIISIDEARKKEAFKRINETGIWQSWPFLHFGIKGGNALPPWWWTGSLGAWGCYMSHMSAVQIAMSGNHKSLLVLEDDVFFVDDFESEFRELEENLPRDWEMLFVGGQHIKVPTKVNDYVVRCKDVRGFHAYILRGDGIKKMYARMTDFVNLSIEHDLRLHSRRGHEPLCPTSHPRKQVDEWCGAVPGLKTYASSPWLAGQVGGLSSINGEMKKTFI